MYPAQVCLWVDIYKHWSVFIYKRNFQVLAKSEKIGKEGFFVSHKHMSARLYTLTQKFPLAQLSRVFENVWSLFKEQISMYPKS